MEYSFLLLCTPTGYQYFTKLVTTKFIFLVNGYQKLTKLVTIFKKLVTIFLVNWLPVGASGYQKFTKVVTSILQCFYKTDLKQPINITDNNKPFF